MERMIIYRTTDKLVYAVIDIAGEYEVPEAIVPEQSHLIICEKGKEKLKDDIKGLYLLNAKELEDA